MWPSALQSLSRGVLQLLYPAHCLLCDQGIPEGSPYSSLCSACLLSLASDASETCPGCAATLGAFVSPGQGCPACSLHVFHFDAAVRLGVYRDEMRGAILKMKSPTGDGLAEVMGTVFARTRQADLSRHPWNVVVPIPLHWRHRMIRGHNQAEEMARGIATECGVPCQTNWLRRTRPVVQHEQPSARARWDNIRGAFATTRHASLAGATVLLTDDVMTTGSTLSEAAKVLKAAGAKRVIAATLARRERLNVSER